MVGLAFSFMSWPLSNWKIIHLCFYARNSQATTFLILQQINSSERYISLLLTFWMNCVRDISATLRIQPNPPIKNKQTKLCRSLIEYLICQDQIIISLGLTHRFPLQKWLWREWMPWQDFPPVLQRERTFIMSYLRVPLIMGLFESKKLILEWQILSF